MIRPTRLQLAALLSASLHAGCIALLLPHRTDRGSPAPIIVEVELLDQAARTQGAPATPAAPSDPAPPPADEPGDVRTPTTPPRPPAAAQTPVRLGDSDAPDQEAVRVTGLGVVPPRGDRRNRPPSYPPAAARRGAEGTVRLLVHVTQAGLIAWVDVMESSGDASLDQAARAAVERWRFEPARNEAGAIPFEFPMNIRFSLGD